MDERFGKDTNEAITAYWHDLYLEIVELCKDPSIYGQTEFEKGYVSGLRSVLHIIHVQSGVFGISLPCAEFDLDTWLTDPYSHVSGVQSE
jgi:hypothetical protein